ncbi:hypothetical protein FV185_18810 [Ferrovum sp. PN-J185]|nr:hypothetical protein FV185_18810 [Ferrovum sp. PN-J185]
MSINLKNIILRLVLVTFLFQSFLVVGSFQLLTIKVAKESHYTFQICSATGLQWINLDKSNTDKTSPSYQHCPFCALTSVVNSTNFLVPIKHDLLVSHLKIYSKLQYTKRTPFSTPYSQAPPLLS